MPTLKTSQALSLIHEAQELVPRIPKNQREDLEAHIRAVSSIVVLYLRHREPEVTQDQREQFVSLMARVIELKERKL